MARDILRDDNDDIRFSDGELMFGESFWQEVAFILKLNPGELKHAPLIGPALVRYVKGNATDAEIESLLSVHFKMDGKDYREIKKLIHTKR
jgi:hypothetical protein